jgi:hypothetical protein
MQKQRMTWRFEGLDMEIDGTARARMPQIVPVIAAATKEFIFIASGLVCVLMVIAFVCCVTAAVMA